MHVKVVNMFWNKTTQSCASKAYCNGKLPNIKAMDGWTIIDEWMDIMSEWK